MNHKQIKLFDDGTINQRKKSYRAIRHDVVREKQKKYSDDLHHPSQKTKQVRKILSERCGWGDMSILEFFAGVGNLTKVYSEFGEVLAFEKNKKNFDKLLANTNDSMLVRCENADSYREYHRHIYLKMKYDVIDLDPYGFPNRFFPDIYLLIDDGVLFVTMPKPYVNILNGITQTHLVSYFGEQNPSMEKIIESLAVWGLCHWRRITLLDALDLKSVWRFAVEVKKVKATEYTGVRNR